MGRQTNRLTVAQVRSARPAVREDGTTKQKVLVDGHGLMLRVTAAGSKQWVQRLRIGDGRYDLGLGGADLVSLAEARQVAFENRKLARSGGDLRRVQAPKIPTFSEAFAATLDLKRPTFKPGSKSAKDWSASMTMHVLPKIGELPIDRIGPTAITSVIRPLAEAGKFATLRALRPRLKAVLDWATVNEFREAADVLGPAYGNLPKDKTGSKHHEALPWAAVGPELRRFEETQCAPMTKLLVRLIALTACRPGEARLMMHGQVDVGAKVWIRPAEFMKGNRQHRIPLSDAALDIIAEARKLSPHGALVFKGTRGKPLGENTVTGALRDARVKSSGHGFRSSFKDWAREHDVPELLSEFSLAHVEGSSTVAAYARDDLLEKRRPVLRAWAEAILC